MKKQKEKRTIQIWTYLTPAENEQFQKIYLNSACQDQSSYTRKLILGQPITLFYRDQTLDEFIGQATRIKKALDEILEKWPPGESDRKELVRLIGETKELMIKISDHVCKIEIRPRCRRRPTVS